jgi:hypothetical protein
LQTAKMQAKKICSSFWDALYPNLITLVNPQPTINRRTTNIKRLSNF